MNYLCGVAPYTSILRRVELICDLLGEVAVKLRRYWQLAWGERFVAAKCDIVLGDYRQLRNRSNDSFRNVQCQLASTIYIFLIKIVNFFLAVLGTALAV